jgi:hypothetical protein
MIAFFSNFKEKKMNQRDQFLKEFRGSAIGTVTDQSSTEEQFQNEVLRPILKLQNDILIASFIDHLTKNKIDFNSFSVDKKMAVIDNSIQKDIKFRNTLKGLIIGLFTSDDFSTYANNETNLTKRMMTMLIERLKSQVQLI